jgi:class 3 adenylate cyclase/tetratricopeptide (TPR) repeat protein
MRGSAVIVCPNCGEENPARARFCLSCGTALDHAPAQRREERKLVSILFCDLVGFTARSDRADPEDVRATLRPYHERLRKEIERFGGTVEKFIGDAVMAVFGAPVAHEDDAERAVRSALRIVDAIKEMNEERPGLDLSVRIGVNTGEAVVALDARLAEGEGIVTGDVVNTAARLQTVAPTGGVVVGEVTYRATKDLVSYEPLDPVTVKGKAEPLPIWRAVEARSRFGVDVEQGTRTPFVGRQNDFAVLTQTFDRAVSEPSVQLVTITGEPGVGKTRLLWEFRRELDDRPDLIYWRQGRCLPYGEGVTYWALGEMVKAQAGVLETDSPDDALAKLDTALAALINDASERDWLRGRLAPLVGIAGQESQGESRDEAFAAWGRFVEAIAARDPLVLVFEDLHWADGPLVEFVEHLVEWSSDVPLFVICSARPELYERHPGWGGGKRNSTTISLAPLSGADTARLLSALLEQAVLPADVQSELLDRAGGNPLFAEEFVRMLVDRGILERHGASLRLTVGPDDVPMPESVHASIGARLDTLSPDRKALLQDASVIGKVFWSGALASMGRGDARAIRETLHDLSRKELVRTVRTTSVEGEAEYSFWHALVRDVAYGQIPRAERASKHLAVADWIEGMAGERLADQAEFLAYHFERAIELTSAAGQDPGDDLRRKASRALAMAGERASRLDVRKGGAFHARAEAVLPEGDPDRLFLHVRAVEAAAQLGEASAEEMIAAYRAAIDDFRQRDDPLHAGAMLVDLSRFTKAVGDTEQADRTSQEALALLEPLGPTRELAFSYANHAGNRMLVADREAWGHYTDAALELAERLDLPEVTVRGLQYRGIFRILGGDLEGRADLEEALRMGLELGLGNTTAVAFTNLADWIAELEGPEPSLAKYEEGIRFAERRGLQNISTWMRGEMTWRMFDLGRWDDVLRTADEIARWYGGRTPGQPLLFARTMEARVRMYRGEFERSGRMIEEVLPVARESGDVQAYRPALTVAAMHAVLTGRSDDARGLLDEFDAEPSGEGTARTFGMLEATMAARMLGDAERARMLAAIEPAAVPKFPLGVATVIASDAEAREAAGEHETALPRYEDAAERWRQTGHVFGQALALSGMAGCLDALGRAPEANSRSVEAAVIFERLGASALFATSSEPGRSGSSARS